jgi:hypothetical protein
MLDIHLHGVWGSGPADVFAVGGDIWDSGLGIVLHYDGRQWSAMDTGPLSRLNAVWGTSASDVFAVGTGGTIFHYDGTAWTPLENGTGTDLNAVWGTSPSDVFAAGYDVESRSAVILHYDGLAWSSTAAGTREELRGLWGSSASDVFAVGTNGTILHYAESTAPEPGPAPNPASLPADAGGAAGTSPPLISSLQADSGRPGEVLTVTITGVNLGGATAVDFGSGIAISEICLVSDTEIAASIAIESEAAPGKRTIHVFAPQGMATVPGGFVVQDDGARLHLWVYLAAAVGGLAALGLLASIELRLRRRAAR